MKPNQAVIVAMHLLGLRLTSLLEIIITIKDVDINSRTILYKYNLCIAKRVTENRVNSNTRGGTNL